MINENKTYSLTKRETQIITCLSKGKLYKEIAHENSISIETVKKHAKNIYKKLGVRNRTEAANKVNN